MRSYGAGTSTACGFQWLKRLPRVVSAGRRLFLVLPPKSNLPPITFRY